MRDFFGVENETKLRQGAVMQVTLEIPNDEAEVLSSGLDDLQRAALESLVASGYRERVLSFKQVRRLMGFDNRWDTEAVLKKHGVWPNTSLVEVMEDCETAAEIFARN